VRPPKYASPCRPFPPSHFDCGRSCFRELCIGCFLIFTTLVCRAQEKGVTPFKDVPRRNETELQDKNGEVRFWIDKIGRTHSPDIMLQQQGYNKWLHVSFAGLIGAGISAPSGIELVAPQPPGERGMKSTGVFQVPWSIRENGVLTRDTNSIPFYKAGVQWNYAAANLRTDCQELHNSVDSSIDCGRYQINWNTSGQIRTPAGKDPFFLEIRYVELQKAKKILRGWQELLDSIITVTATGQRGNAARDRQENARRQTFKGEFDADDFPSPPDWLTAQVDAGKLTPEFLKQLEDIEKDVQLYLNADKMERELGQNRVRGNPTNP
jgi:hypothetical protein